MDSTRFGGALDNVGGPMLASLLAQVAPYGNVASCGLAGSPALDATVMPFIIRGVSLLGIASAGTARDLRDAVWSRLATDWKPAALDAIATREIGLEALPQAFPAHAGRALLWSDDRENVNHGCVIWLSQAYNHATLEGPNGTHPDC